MSQTALDLKVVRRSIDNELPTRRPGRGMRRAGHGWPAAASQTWMSAEPGSMPRSGRRCVRSPRIDRLPRVASLLLRQRLFRGAERRAPAQAFAGHAGEEPHHALAAFEIRSEEHTSDLQS